MLESEIIQWWKSFLLLVLVPRKSIYNSKSIYTPNENKKSLIRQGNHYLIRNHHRFKPVLLFKPHSYLVAHVCKIKRYILRFHSLDFHNLSVCRISFIVIPTKSSAFGKKIKSFSRHILIVHLRIAAFHFCKFKIPLYIHCLWKGAAVGLFCFWSPFLGPSFRFPTWIKR